MDSRRWALGLVVLLSLSKFGSERAEAQPDAMAEALETVDPNVEELRLVLGEQRVISAEGVKSYSEATRGIVDVKLTHDAKQFVVVATAPGKTSLLFLLSNGKDRHLNVVVQDPAATLSPAPGTFTVDRVENIRLDFYFVALNRSYGHKMGLGYPAAIQGGTFGASYDFLTQSFTSATAVVEDQALLRLDMAQATGWAKVLRQAAVITRNGQIATFSGGGEVNVAVPGGLTSTIQSISYGSDIQVLPRFDRESGRLEVEVQADVSDLTDDHGTGIPGRTHSVLKTMVNVTLGQVIVVGGLSAASETQGRTGVPFLSLIPVLGALFRTNAAERAQTDTLVFIVPSVVDTPPAEARRQLGAALENYGKFRGEKKVQDAIRASERQP